MCIDKVGMWTNLFFKCVFFYSPGSKSEKMEKGVKDLNNAQLNKNDNDEKNQAFEIEEKNCFRSLDDFKKY